MILFGGKYIGLNHNSVGSRPRSARWKDANASA